MGRFLSGEWVNDFVPVSSLDIVKAEVYAEINSVKQDISLEIQSVKDRVDVIETKPIEGVK